jgi:catechol 2,3-dioxygenase-like lactoylglutathione lyase family enzyme
MAENKTQPTAASVDEFIAGIDNPRRRADALAALAMYQEVTGLPPVMWGPSIIGFGSMRYVYESGRAGEMPLAAFSPRKANLTFYVGDGFEGAAALYARLGKHRKTVACLYVNKLDDVDLAALRAIIAGQFAQDRAGGGM